MPTDRKRRLVRRTIFWLFCFVLSSVLAGSLALGQQASSSGPPRTRTDNVKETIHGVTLTDPYRWLEDQSSPETRAWIDAQNQYTDKLLGALPGRDSIKQRATELMKVDTAGLPREENGRYFFFKRLASQDLSVLYVRKGLAGKDEVLLDPHPMSKDHTTSVTRLDVSKDGTELVYGVRQGGEDELSVHLMNVDTRKDLPDQLPKAVYFGISLTKDKKGLYYTRMTKAGPRVYFHAMGTNPAQDKELFGQGYGPEKIIDAGLSEDGRYLLIHVFHGASADKTEVYVQDLAGGKPMVTVVKDLDARTIAEICGNSLVLHTNWKAPRGRILVADLNNPTPDHWREIVPESDAPIEGIVPAGGKIFVSYTRNASSQVKVFGLDGKPIRDVQLPAIGSVAGFSGRWESKEVFYSFTSFPTPSTIYRCDADTGRQQVWARPQIPIQSDNFEVKQVWFASKDGTKVPMFLVQRKGSKPDASTPALMTGYGGFNVSETPFFSAMAALWVERGGLFVEVNLRGGGEFGEEWHKAGMRQHKQNVFDDLYAAADWLIKNHYTSASKLAITGASNGGLLVGAALTQRPELFRAVVCSYPLLDMIRYHKFFMGPFWIPEYGSADNAEQFKYLLAYSPYQNVKRGVKYPAVLMVSGDSDTRVAPLHARKMAALLQADTGSTNPVLLHYDTKSGHSGGKPISKQIDDLTDELSFLFWQLGATPAASK